MHGILFKELKTYVTEEWGSDAWDESLDEAGIEPKLYLPVTEYPDDEARRLIDAVSSISGVDRETLLEEFGEALAPALLNTFKAHVKTGWDAFDLLEHTKNQVFTVLQSEDGGPDEVRTDRTADDRVVIKYGSALEMCSLTKGIVRGIADEHDEPVDVTESKCMHDGYDHCEIIIEGR